MKKKLFTGILLMLLQIPLLYSQTEFKPEIKIGGTIFTGWEFNVDNAEFISKLDTNSADANIPFGYSPVKNQFETSKNSFYLERAYINIWGYLTPQIKARITPDVHIIKDGDGKNQFAVDIKFAYLNYVPLQLESGLNLGFTLGVIPNNWTSTADKYWGFRGLAKTITDLNWTLSANKTGNTVTRTVGSYFSTADLGFDIMLALPKGYAEVNMSILNGNGFRNLSLDNRFKDILATAFIHPLAPQIKKRTEFFKSKGKDRIDGITDLTFGGFAYIGKLDKGENYATNGAQYQRNRFGGMLHTKYNFKNIGFVRFGGEFSVQSNQDPSSVKPDSVINTNTTGISTYLEINPPVKELAEKLSILVRYDIFDPNTGNTDASVTTFNNNTDKQSFMLLGLTFKPAKNLLLGVTYQSVTYNQNFVVKYDGTTTKTDGIMKFTGILDF